MDSLPFQKEKFFNPVGEQEYKFKTEEPILPIELASPVANSAKNITVSSFMATWDKVVFPKEEVTYLLDVSIDLFNTYLDGYHNKKITGLSDYVVGLKSFTTYYFRVRSVNSKGISSYSNIIETYTKMLPPVALDATSVSSSSFVANWNIVNNVNGYYLDVSTTPLFNSYVVENLFVGDTKRVVTGLTPSNDYYYRVRAYHTNSNTTSTNSNIIKLTSNMGSPFLIDVTDVTTSSFKLNWGLVEDAVDYELDVSTDILFNSFVFGYQQLSVGNVDFYDITGLNENTSYYLRLRSVNIANDRSSYSNILTGITNISTPVAISATNVTSTSFTSNWNTSSFNFGYYVDVSSDNFLTYLVGYENLLVSGTSLNVLGLTSDTEYKYRVRVVGLNGNTTTNSNVITQTTVVNAPVAIAPINIVSNGFRARWNSVVNGVTYYLDVSTDSNFNTLILNGVSTTNTYYDVTGLSSLTTYYYRVRVGNVNGVSSNSNTITTLTSIVAPIATAYNNPSTISFDANWNSVSGSDGYYLDVSSDNFTTYISGYNNKFVTSTTDSVTGLTADTEYKYRVRSRYNGGQFTSINSNVVTANTLLNPPVATSATNVGSTSFDANWNNVSNAIEYRIDVSSDNFVTNLPSYDNYPVLTNILSITGLNVFTEYKYRVRAYNIDGYISGYSNVITQETLNTAPTITSATNVAETSFTLNWDNIIGIVEYRLDVSLVNNFSSYVSGYNNRQVLTNTEDVVGLEQNTTYYCRVRAVFISSTSSNSNVYSVTTNPFLLNLRFVEGSGTSIQDFSPFNNDGEILPTSPDPTFTILNLPFNEGDGHVLNDTSINNNTGYLYTTEKVVYSKLVSGKYAIMSKDANGLSPEVNLTNDNTSDYLYPSFSEDGLKIVYVKITSGVYDLGVMNYDGTNNNSINIGSVHVKESPKFAPNGVNIIYTRYNLTNTSSTIFITNVHGSFDYDVTGAFYFDKYPSWINDNEILYETVIISGGNYYIKKLNLVTSGLVTVYTNTTNNTMQPTLSRDKTKVVFVKYESPTKQNLAKVNIDGTGYALIEDLTSTSYNPIVSYNNKIVFLSDRYNSNYYIWVVNIDGTNPFRFITNDLDISDLNTFTDYHDFSTENLIAHITFSEGSDNKLYDGSLNNNSGLIQLLTPVTVSATNITINSFDANWDVMVGITTYKLDVSNDNFTTFLLQDYTVTNTTITVTGLSSGIEYQYRVRATLDTLVSNNSNVTTVVTL